MLFDWFTVVAQVLNFVVLVWLLKRFLYKPVLDAIDAREKRILAELADADSKQAEAERQRAEFQHKSAELDKERAGLLAEAREQAKAERQRLLDEARNAADAVAATRRDALRSDARTLDRELAAMTQREVFAIARKALGELATTSLEERMSEVFACRLRALAGQPKALLTEALTTASEPALVQSAFELPPALRAELQRALNETFATDIRVRFETAPALVSGIELTAKGQKLAWSIDDYLTSLEKRVGRLLKEQGDPDRQSKAGSQSNGLLTGPEP